MKEVYVLRHAPKDNVTGDLTEEGIEHAKQVSNNLPDFNVVISSDAPRTQQTAIILTGITPHVDRRAGYYMTAPELSKSINERAKVHPHGFTGAFLEYPEIQDNIIKQAKELISLVTETLKDMKPDQKALIVSHDITMVPAYQILKKQIEPEEIRPFRPLSGFIVDENMNVHPYQAE